MKLIVFGLIVCAITGIAAQESNDVQNPDEIQDDLMSSNSWSWLDLFNTLSELIHGKKEPDVDINQLINQTIPDQPVDVHTVNDEGNDIGYEVVTAVVYEEVTVSNVSRDNISEGGDIMTELSHSEAIPPTINVTNEVKNDNGSTNFTIHALTADAETPTNSSTVPQSPPFLNPHLSLQEALALFRDYEDKQALQDHRKQDGQMPDMLEPQNNTGLIGAALGRLGENVSSPAKNSSSQDGLMMTPATDRDRIGELEKFLPDFLQAYPPWETEAQSNSSQPSMNSTLSMNSSADSDGLAAPTEKPWMDASSWPIQGHTISSLDLGHTDLPKQENGTNFGTDTPLVSSKPPPPPPPTPPTPPSSSSSSPPVFQYAVGWEDERIHQPSTANENEVVEEASTGSTPTQLPREFWNVNLKGDDHDSNSKEDDFYLELLSTSSYGEGVTERLTNTTTPKCDWMGGANTNAFVRLIDKVCHTLKPLPIVFNILLLVTLGIISVAVCMIACICGRRCRRRGEEKDSLIEAGTRREKRSLLQV